MDSDINVVADNFTALINELAKIKGASVKIREISELFEASLLQSSSSNLEQLPDCSSQGCSGGEATMREGTWKVDITGHGKLMMGERITK